MAIPAFLAFIFRLISAGSELSGPEIEKREGPQRATVLSSCTLQSAIDPGSSTCPTMNQLPVETSQGLLARSNNVVSASVKAKKLHDHPEVDHEDSDRSGNSGNQLVFDGLSDEPMVKYDDFESVGKPFPPHFDEDEDVVNAQSPIICKLSGSRSATSSPSCVSALKDHEPSWTIQEFQEYLGMLELLQDACSNSDGEEMCLSTANLGKMERLLTSLLPQGV